MLEQAALVAAHVSPGNLKWSERREARAGFAPRPEPINPAWKTAPLKLNWMNRPMNADIQKTKTESHDQTEKEEREPTTIESLEYFQKWLEKKDDKLRELRGTGASRKMINWTLNDIAHLRCAIKAIHRAHNLP